jgi:predicted metal-dependent hydrolase
MLLFRSEQHVDRWCTQWKRERGGVFSLKQGWDLAQKWYGDRLSPEWKPKSHAEAEALFESCGLLGDFYKFGNSR